MSGAPRGILAGVGHFATHFATPEVADGAVAAGEDAEPGNVGVVGADVGAGVVAARIGVELRFFQPRSFL